MKMLMKLETWSITGVYTEVKVCTVLYYIA